MQEHQHRQFVMANTEQKQQSYLLVGNCPCGGRGLDQKAGSIDTAALCRSVQGRLAVCVHGIRFGTLGQEILHLRNA